MTKEIQILSSSDWATFCAMPVCDHWNLEPNIFLASLLLSKVKTGFLQISSMQSSFAKAAYVAALFASLSLRIVNYNHSQIQEAS